MSEQEGNPCVGGTCVDVRYLKEPPSSRCSTGVIYACITSTLTLFLPLGGVSKPKSLLKADSTAGKGF